MNLLKKLGRVLAGALLKFSLFSLATVASLVMVLGGPTGLKQALKQSGIYNNFVDNAIQANQKQTDQNGSIPLDNPEVKAAAKSAFPPQFLQASTEQIVDGTYHWLNGAVPVPDFKVDLSGPKQNFANALGDYALKRAQSLPVCTLQQARLLQPDNIDPYKVPCLPPGFNPASLRGQVVKDAVSNTDFLKDTAITADNLPKDDTGKTPFQKLEQVPKIFHLTTIAPYVLGGLAAISALALIFLHDQRRRGLHAVGVIFLGSGVFLFISALLLGYLVNRASLPNGGLAKLSGENNFQPALISIFKSLNNALTHKLFIFCGVYILVGAGLILYIRLTRPKQALPVDESKNDGENPIGHQPEQPEETTAKYSKTE